jgi:hypothetical protein
LPPGYSISRKIPTSLDKIPSYLTSPWLRGSECVLEVRLRLEGGKKAIFKVQLKCQEYEAFRVYTGLSKTESSFQAALKKMTITTCPIKWLFSITEIVPSFSSFVSVSLIS